MPIIEVSLDTACHTSGGTVMGLSKKVTALNKESCLTSIDEIVRPQEINTEIERLYNLYLPEIVNSIELHCGENRDIAYLELNKLFGSISINLLNTQEKWQIMIDIPKATKNLAFRAYNYYKNLFRDQHQLIQHLNPNDNTKIKVVKLENAMRSRLKLGSCSFGK
jgi:hypothetical protein